MGDYAVAALMLVALAAVSNFGEKPVLSKSCDGTDLGLVVICR